jgi:phosphatidylglycerol lysyltransferase
LKKYGKNSLSFLTLSNSLIAHYGEWSGYIAHKNFLKSATILGDPIVPNSSLEDAIDDLKENLLLKKYHINYFLCSDKSISILKRKGFKCFYVGMEAVVDLRKFNIKGRKKWKIKSSLNYAKRNNMKVEEYIYSKNNKSKEVENEIISISDEWCRLKKTPELSFAFGNVNFDDYEGIRYFVCKHKEKIVGFVSYYPIFGLNSYYLDLTRRGIHSPRGTIDNLIVKSFEILKKEKIKKIYIGFSPFSFLSYESSINTRFYTNLFKLAKPFFEFFYPTESELFFKKKYATDWEPNYVVFYPRVSLRNLLSLINSLYKGGIAAFIIAKIKYLFLRS